MDHDRSALRIAAMFVLCIGGYWAFMEAEKSNVGAGRVGPGAQCTIAAQFLGKC